jgi:hypothetical protein
VYITTPFPRKRGLSSYANTIAKADQRLLGIPYRVTRYAHPRAHTALQYSFSPLEYMGGETKQICHKTSTWIRCHTPLRAQEVTGVIGNDIAMNLGFNRRPTMIQLTSVHEFVAQILSCNLG